MRPISVLDMLENTSTGGDPLDQHLNMFPGNQAAAEIARSVGDIPWRTVTTPQLTKVAKTLKAAGYTVHRPRFQEPVLSAVESDVMFMRGGEYSMLTVLVMPDLTTMIPDRATLTAVQAAFHQHGIPVTINVEHVLILTARDTDAREASCRSATFERNCTPEQINSVLSRCPDAFAGRPGSLSFVDQFGVDDGLKWMQMTGTSKTDLAACVRMNADMVDLDPQVRQVMFEAIINADDAARTQQLDAGVQPDEHMARRLVKTIGEHGIDTLRTAVMELSGSLRDLLFASCQPFQPPDIVLRGRVFSAALNACALGDERRKQYGERVLDTTLMWLNTSEAFLDFVPRASQIGGWRRLTFAGWMNTGLSPNEASTMLDLIDIAHQEEVGHRSPSVLSIARTGMQNNIVDWNLIAKQIVEKDPDEFCRRHHVAALNDTVSVGNDQVACRA